MIRRAALFALLFFVLPLASASAATCTVNCAGPVKVGATIPTDKQPPATGPVTIPIGGPAGLNPTPTPSTAPPYVNGPPSAPDSMQAIGMSDVTCSNLTGATPEVARNCASDSRVSSAYPASNYALDTNIDTGVTQIANNLDAAIDNGLSMLWGLFATVMSWILAVLGVCFSFDLFAGGLARISPALANMERTLFAPLLGLALIVGGFVATTNLARDDHGRLLGHVVKMVVLMVAGILIMTNPGLVFSQADGMANTLANAAVGAPGGNVNGSASFSNAEPALWKATVEQSWCQAEFSDTSWCMAPPDAAMLREKVSVIAGLKVSSPPPTFTAPAVPGQPIFTTPGPSPQQAAAIAQRLNDAQTNGELSLSFPAGYDQRNALTSPSFASTLQSEHPDLVAQRQAGGIMNRVIATVMGGISGIACVLVLVFVGLQIVGASIMFVVLLLCAPAAALMAVTEGGQLAFVGWLRALLRALVVKVIYGVILGVLIVASTVLFDISSSLSYFFGWVVSVAFWLAVYHHRRAPMELLGARGVPDYNPVRAVRSAGRHYYTNRYRPAPDALRPRTNP